MNDKKGIFRWIQSMKFALRGIADLFSNHKNARIHLFFTFAVILSGIIFKVNPMEWCILILAMGGVLMAEAFNTALEYLTDLVSPEHHPLAGKAKDVAAAAVLFFAIASAIVGIIIFLPKALKMIGLAYF